MTLNIIKGLDKKELYISDTFTIYIIKCLDKKELYFSDIFTIYLDLP